MGFPDIKLQREHLDRTKDDIPQILIHVKKEESCRQNFRFHSLVSRSTRICINHSDYTELKKIVKLILSVLVILFLVKLKLS